MIAYPEIEPVAVAIGPLKVHWYGLMYLGAFAFAWWFARLRSKRSFSPVAAKDVDDLIFYGALGVVLGGRFGYVFFYQFDRFLEDPTWLFKVWQGGMSFHGGFIGVCLAVILYSRKLNIRLGDLADFVAPIVPVGLGLGRLGNFIGQELWGRAGEVPWAMIFPNDPLQIARHPSQLYQALLEGFLLFLLLAIYSRVQRPRWSVAGMFMVFYGVFRYLAEFFREPDSHIGFDLFGWMTRGQLLSLPMIIVGVGFIIFAYRGHNRS